MLPRCVARAGTSSAPFAGMCDEAQRCCSVRLRCLSHRHRHRHLPPLHLQYHHCARLPSRQGGHEEVLAPQHPRKLGPPGRYSVAALLHVCDSSRFAEFGLVVCHPARIYIPSSISECRGYPLQRHSCRPRRTRQCSTITRTPPSCTITSIQNRLP